MSAYAPPPRRPSSPLGGLVACAAALVTLALVLL